MGRKVIKFDLNGKIIFSKPFQSNDNLASVREKIKDRINCSFQFLDQDNNLIYVNDENDFIIEDILIGQIMKLKSVEDTDSNMMNLNILVNGKKTCSLILKNELTLNKTRRLINKEIKGNYIFLDIDGNQIEETDENDFIIEDILNNGEIKLKQDTIDSPSLIPISINKKINDFSKYEIIEKNDLLTLYKYSNKERQTNRK